MSPTSTDSPARPAGRVGGVYVALLTPFDETGAVDAAALDALVQHVLAAGVDGVVALGTTGEFPDLGDEDRDLVVRTTVAAVGGRVPVVVGIGALSTREACRCAAAAERAGADVVLALPPLFWKLDDDGLFAHFAAVAAATALPVLLYDIPIFTGASLSPALVGRIARELPQVVGIKLTVQDFGSVAAVLAEVKPSRPDFSVTVGFEDLVLSAVLAGGDGAISGMANFLAPTLVRLVAAATSGDLETAADAHREVMRLFPVYFQANPPVLALKHLSVASGVPIGTTVRCAHQGGPDVASSLQEWLRTASAATRP